MFDIYRIWQKEVVQAVHDVKVMNVIVAIVSELVSVHACLAFCMREPLANASFRRGRLIGAARADTM